MSTFYLLVQCGNCDEDIYSGPNLTLIEHNGLPAITWDLAACESFDCPNCGAQNYTGDFEIETEGGQDPDELDAAMRGDGEEDAS